mmetsp:Transcript_10651/g.39094  ORF Transcript_10651/g.39094 Transcript_10651/m.39094 type:complete len:652 (+) Transcript_10651:102-2057(+)
MGDCDPSFELCEEDAGARALLGAPLAPELNCDPSFDDCGPYGTGEGLQTLYDSGAEQLRPVHPKESMVDNLYLLGHFVETSTDTNVPVLQAATAGIALLVAVFGARLYQPRFHRSPSSFGKPALCLSELKSVQAQTKSALLDLEVSLLAVQNQDCSPEGERCKQLRASLQTLKGFLSTYEEQSKLCKCEQRESLHDLFDQMLRLCEPLLEKAEACLSLLAEPDTAAPLSRHPGMESSVVAINLGDGSHEQEWEDEFEKIDGAIRLAEAAGMLSRVRQLERTKLEYIDKHLHAIESVRRAEGAVTAPATPTISAIEQSLCDAEEATAESGPGARKDSCTMTPEKPPDPAPTFTPPRTVEEARLLLELQMFQEKRLQRFEDSLHRRREHAHRTVKLIETRLYRALKLSYKRERHELLVRDVAIQEESLAAMWQTEVRKENERRDEAANAWIVGLCRATATACICLRLSPWWDAMMRHIESEASLLVQSFPWPFSQLRLGMPLSVAKVVPHGLLLALAIDYLPSKTLRSIASSLVVGSLATLYCLLGPEILWAGTTRVWADLKYVLLGGLARYVSDSLVLRWFLNDMLALRRWNRASDRVWTLRRVVDAIFVGTSVYSCLGASGLPRYHEYNMVALVLAGAVLIGNFFHGQRCL